MDEKITVDEPLKEASSGVVENPLTEPAQLREVKHHDAIENSPVHDHPLPKVESKKSWKVLGGSMAVVLVLVLILVIVVHFSKDEIKTICFGDSCIKGVPQGQYIFNGFQFYQFQDLWYTQIQQGTIQVNTQFSFGPRDVQDVPIIGTLNATFHDSPVIYVTSDLSEPALNVTGLASGELQLNLAQAFKARLVAACLNHDVPACEIVPLISCENTNNATVIELRQESPVQVTFDGNCVIIQGEDIDLVRAVDRVLLRWYGILQ